MRGVSGNPGGRAVGSRNRIQTDFLRELADAFAQGGREVMDRVMADDPATFLKVLLRGRSVPRRALLCTRDFGHGAARGGRNGGSSTIHNQICYAMWLSPSRHSISATVRER